MMRRSTSYELHLGSQVPRFVQKCQWACGEELVTAGKNDYLLARSFGISVFNDRSGNEQKRYVHFSNDCLKEYARR